MAWQSVLIQNLIWKYKLDCRMAIKNKMVFRSFSENKLISSSIFEFCAKLSPNVPRNEDWSPNSVFFCWFLCPLLYNIIRSVKVAEMWFWLWVSTFLGTYSQLEIVLQKLRKACSYLSRMLSWFSTIIESKESRFL